MSYDETLETKKSIFIIENINQEKGTCTVRFINPFGPIERGILKKEEIDPSVENPNHDIVYVYTLPLDDEGQYYPVDALIKHFAAQYPHSEFEVMNMRMKAKKRTDYDKVLNERFDVNLQFSKPIHLSNFRVFPEQDEIEIETI